MELEATVEKAIGLSVTGMTCGSCARTIERALSKVPGVRHASVDFRKKLAVVEGEASTDALIEAVRAVGYGATETSEFDDAETADHRKGCCG